MRSLCLVITLEFLSFKLEYNMACMYMPGIKMIGNDVWQALQRNVQNVRSLIIQIFSKEIYLQVSFVDRVVWHKL